MYNAIKFCVTCGKRATIYGGHVLKRNEHIIAGFCSDECYNSIESDQNGCFGMYLKSMGLINDIFHDETDIIIDENMDKDMKSISLEELVEMIIQSNVFLNGRFDKNIYLKDSDGNYHIVNYFDMLGDRLRCEDGYFDYFEYISTSYKPRLFIEN